MRLRIFMCILILIFIPITGCSWDKTAIKVPDGVELKGEVIRIFELKDAFADREQAAKFRTKAIELAKKYNLTIEYMGEGSRVELEKQINRTLTGSSDCQILAVDSTYSHRLIADSIFQPLDKYSNDLKLNESKYWNTSAMSAGLKYNGQLFGIVPYERAIDRIKGMRFLAFNKTVIGNTPFEMQEKGMWSYEKFSELATEIGSQVKGREKMSGVVPAGDSLFLGLKDAVGGTVVSQADGKYVSAFNSDSTKSILDLMLRINGTALRTPVFRETHDTEKQRFENDLAGMMPVELNTFVPQMSQKIGLALFPTPDGKNFVTGDYYYPVCGIVDRVKPGQAAFVMAKLYSADSAPDNKKDAGDIIYKLGFEAEYIATVEKALNSVKYNADAAYLPLPSRVTDILSGDVKIDEFINKTHSQIQYRIDGIWQADRFAG